MPSSEKRGQHVGQKTFSLTLNEGDMKSAFQHYIIKADPRPDIFALTCSIWALGVVLHKEHLMVWADVWQKHTLTCVMTQKKCREPPKKLCPSVLREDENSICPGSGGECCVNNKLSFWQLVWTRGTDCKLCIPLSPPVFDVRLYSVPVYPD